MGAGFQVFNADGVIQIDADYINPRLTGKVVVSPNNINNTIAFRYGIDIRIDGSTPLVAAIASENTFVMVFVNAGIRYVRVENANGTPVTLFIFDVVPPSSSAKFGFEVYNASGGLVFSAAEKYCRILGQLKLNFSNDAFSSRSYSYPGKNVAVIANTTARVANSGPSADISKWDTTFYMSCFRNNGADTAILSYPIVRTVVGASSPPPAATEVTGNYLLVDVTGM